MFSGALELLQSLRYQSTMQKLFLECNKIIISPTANGGTDKDVLRFSRYLDENPSLLSLDFSHKSKKDQERKNEVSGYLKVLIPLPFPLRQHTHTHTHARTHTRACARAHTHKRIHIHILPCAHTLKEFVSNSDKGWKLCEYEDWSTAGKKQNITLLERSLVTNNSCKKEEGQVRIDSPGRIENDMECTKVNKVCLSGSFLIFFFLNYNKFCFKM